MKITFITIGHCSDKSIKELIERYLKRLKHYTRFEMRELPDIKGVRNLSQEKQKDLEGKSILEQVSPGNTLLLLDEGGKEYTSRAFSEMINKHLVNVTRDLIFVVCGPYGFSCEVYSRAHGKVSLSQMTFTHEMARLFFIEQVYRAFTIIKGENYHHD